MVYRELYQIFYENNKFDIPTNILKLEPYFYKFVHVDKSQIVHNPIVKVIHDMNIDDSKLHQNSLNSPFLGVEMNELDRLSCESSMRKHVKDIIEENKNKILEMDAIVNEKINSKTESTNKSATINPNAITNNDIVEPKQKDSIFWCIFIFVYGYSEYLMVGSKYGNRELEEKQKMMVFFKEHQKLLKSTNHKITNGNIQEMQAEYLSFQNETTLLGVIGFSVFYNIRILLVDASKKIYLDFHRTDESVIKTCVLFKNKGIKGSIQYMIDISVTEDNISNIEKTMLCLEHYMKPLRSISTYKVCELEEIATLLMIDYTTKCKKQELYDKIIHYCNFV